MAIPKSNRYRCRCCQCGKTVPLDIPEGVIKRTTYSFKGIRMDTPHDALALKQVYEILKDRPKVRERMPDLLHVLAQEVKGAAVKKMKKEMGW